MFRNDHLATWLEDFWYFISNPKKEEKLMNRKEAYPWRPLVGTWNSGTYDTYVKTDVLTSHNVYTNAMTTGDWQYKYIKAETNCGMINNTSNC